MKRIGIIAAIVALALIPSLPVIASDITTATYHGTIVITNNSTAITNGFVSFSLPTQTLIDNGFLSANCTNSAIRSGTGGDTGYQFGVGDNNTWVFLLSIPGGSQINYHLYTGGTTNMNSRLAYFPGATGMITADNDTYLEPGDNFTITQKAWWDTTAATSSDNVIDFDIGGTATASSEANPAAYAFDNVYTGTSYWETNTALPQWIKYDLGAGRAKRISFYTLSSGDNENASMPKNFTFQVSNNDADWTTLDTQTNQSFTLAETKTYPVTSATSWRYFRINVTAITETPFVRLRIYDIDLKGPAKISSSKTDALTIFTGNQDGEISFATPQMLVTATGISSANHTLEFKADSTNMTIYADGLLKESVPVIAVPNSPDDWNFFTNNVTAYVEYQKIWIGGQLRQHIIWQNAAIFTDQSGKGQDAVPSFRISGTPGLSATLTNYLPITQAQASTTGSEFDPGYDIDLPEQPAGFYGGPSTSVAVPVVGPLIGGVVEGTDLSAANKGAVLTLVWIIAAFGISILAAFWTYKFTMGKLSSRPGSLLLATIVSGVVYYMFVLWGTGAPGYALIIHVVVGIGTMVYARQYGW